MGNSKNSLFKNDCYNWYVALEDRVVGPIDSMSVYEKIISNEITWAHYIQKEGSSEWSRICEIPVFQEEAPRQPSQGAAVKVRVYKKGIRIWYLHYEHSQWGPFSTEEVKDLLKKAKKVQQIFGWKVGMENWEILDQIEEFRLEFPQIDSSTQNDKRKSPRRPLVAKILMTNNQTVIVGVCRDISIGGLQVLSETVPGKVGARLKMNISPSMSKFGRRSGIQSGGMVEPIVAEGVIIRILEGGCGFSFRFENLSERTKQVIETYVQS